VHCATDARLGVIDLIDRLEERVAVDGLLDSARAGLSDALVLRGEPGVGKTSMLDYAAAAATGMQTTRIAGIESETGLGFAALHRLLIPFLPGRERLAPPQRDALGTAFGVVSGAPPDRFLIGLAVLTLLADAATSRPLLCVIDDTQWLDAESSDVLAFVARRLYADRIAMLFAAREPIEGQDSLAGLPELRLRGLTEADARQLLDRRVSAARDPQAVTRIIAETDGNPLALVELGNELDANPLALGPLPSDPLPIGPRLEARFLRQVHTLPAESQSFLLVAAAVDADDSVVWKTAERFGISADAVEGTISARLLIVDPTLKFRHPLIRSAVYAAATPEERRRVHAAVADLTDPVLNADRRAWHRAAAAVGPNEAVAAELERSAGRAQSRGGWSARSAFLARAADLTHPSPRRVELLLAASEAALIAGALHRAHALLDRATPGLQGPLAQAHARRLEAALQSFTSPGQVPAALLAAAVALEPLDVRLARDTYAEALQACLVSCQLTVDTTPVEVARAALAAPQPSREEHTAADVMIDAFATRFAVGYAAAVPALREAVAALSAEEGPPTGLNRWAALGNNAAADLWDADGYRTILTRLEQLERERGALDSLRITLGGIGHSLMWAGQFAEADAAHSEASEISVALGADRATWDMLKVELFAWQGRDADTRTTAELLTGDAIGAIGAGVVENLARIAMAILELGQGHYRQALASAQPAMEEDSPTQGNQALPEVVEAGARCGEEQTATAALDRLSDRAQASATPWALGLLARSRALLADGDAEALYLEAIDHLARTYVVTDLARAHLLYGEWLRRAKRRGDARDHLRTAYQMFSSMGAAAFAERARIELAATGERARKRTFDTGADLTPQERHIAVLASQGETNAEIAAKLFLSPSTVDYHLRRVYRKLSLTSRRELKRALAL
jgi:DNA-binding CsgD family transcriptional regulator